MVKELMEVAFKEKETKNPNFKEADSDHKDGHVEASKKTNYTNSKRDGGW